MIEIRHLRYFAAVAEELHFGRAAERLHMAQSPLSHQIRQLERLLGVVLLERDHHVVGLTDAGRTFLDQAKSILASLDTAVEATQRAGRGEVGSIRIGYVSEMTADLLPESLRVHRARFPEITIELCQDLTGGLLEMFKHERLDVAFVRSPGSIEGLHYEELLREELFLATAARRRAGAEAPGLSTLTNETLILPSYEAARGLRHEIDQALAEAGIEAPLRREAMSPTAALLLVAAGAGVALIPSSVARSYPVAGVELQSLAEKPTTGGGICWRSDECSGVVLGFLATTRRVVAGNTPGRSTRRSQETRRGSLGMA